MNILFDISGTVLGLIDNSLRPGIKELISDLRDRGHRVGFWSGGSPRQMEEFRRVLKDNGIDGDIYSKLQPISFRPDVCVDDSDSEASARTHIVEPYLGKEWEVSQIELAVP